jgi:hypothetical protein
MARLFGQGNCLTSEQQDSLGEITPLDTSCSGVYENTCGINAEELISSYLLYNSLAGTNLTKWGEVNVPWGDVDQSWDSVSIDAPQGYREGDRVLQFEQDGDYVVLYQAVEDIPAPPGPFDPDEWQEVCRIRFQDKSILLSVLAQFSYWSGVEWTVVTDTECGDYSCLYTAISQPGSNPPPNPTYWQRLFCVENGKPSKCKKTVQCGVNRTLVSLSSGDEDLICVPVESTEGVGPSR